MYKWLWMAAVCGLQGCQNHSVAPSGTRIDQGSFILETSQESEQADQRIRFLVLHYTAEDLVNSLKILTGNKVSTHYFIPAKPLIDPASGKPVIWRLVPETLRAWHAGNSFWRGRRNLNDTSIGIEQENLGPTKTILKTYWHPYTPEQIRLVTDLAKQLVQRYNIDPVNVVGHSDIAPLRKQDPGPLFPWQALADAGVGAWPDADTVKILLAGRAKNQTVAMEPLLSKLACYGYAVTSQMTLAEKKQVVAAFQMHFRPRDIRGEPDVETEAIIDALLVKYSVDILSNLHMNVQDSG